MNELILRNLDEHLLERLNQNACLHGITSEEEAKQILVEHLSLPDIKQHALLKAHAIRERTAGRTHTSGVQLKYEIYEKVS